MNRFARWAAVALTTLGLSACLVPEKFETAVRFRPDGSYTYQYDGTAVHYLAAAALKETGRLDPKDEDGLRMDAEKGAKAPGVQKMRYTGQGRYEIRIEEEVKAGKPVKSLPIFQLTRDKQGAFLLTVPPLKEKDRQDLRSYGIRIDGKVEVYLPANAKVLEHNASSTPGLLSKSYGWKIGAVDDRPTIRFTLAP